MQEKNGVKEHLITATRSKDKIAAFQQAIDGKPEAYINEILNPLMLCLKLL